MNLVKENFTVLLADDDPEEHARFVKAIHETSEKITIDSVFNGMQLLDHLEKYDGKVKALPDVIITDLYMPFAGGLQVLKQIKTHIRYRQIPIVVFSRSYDNTILARVIGHGASEFHRKPQDYREFADKVAHVLTKISLKAVA